MDPLQPLGRARLRDLGLAVGTLPCGPLNAITDVAGVGVGHVTLIEDQPHVIRSGVTAIVPMLGQLWKSGCFAGFDRYNGFGEVTGTHWISEAGLLSSPIVLTSAFSIGVARDTLLALPFRHGVPERWHQPCAAETYDGVLNDGLAAPVRREHIEAAIATAATGPVAEGAVGGGTGMMSFEFKSGIGTASRCVRAAGQSFTVGVLVQSNFGNRRHLTVDGVPVGRELGYDVTPSPQRRDDGEANETKGSIVIVVATDAPLLPPQLNRLARRANAGLSRVGGFGNNRSGDFALAFSTANVLPFEQTGIVQGLTMLAGEDMNPLLPAAAEAAEEAIVNSMTMAATMSGVRGTTVHELPLRKLQALMQRAGGTPT
ncbi:P1 family peptidase [Roseateles toxinivorans]|uniref:L-aminopeptidase DmpA n=1 Tax=Roseateles toxinivorans TaxID=270368 RepID=A0A4R6QDP0_9BURK|nr:P1 family peptidase [Roseateles toxinivorans]TDP60430.1 L-aminopeptidase DmpA [Roseateles toxinivorans]